MDDTGSPRGSGRFRLPLRVAAMAAIALAMVGALFAQTRSIDNVPLAAVKVRGNRTIPEEAILSHVKSRPGRVASGTMISKDVEQLYRTRWFLSVVPRVTRSEGGPVLIFEVVERPVVARIEYRGNKEIDDEDLAELTGLTEGSPYDPASNIEAARRMENFYKEKGFTFANVTLLSGDEADDRKVIFQIHEGPKVRVENVIFEGNSGWTIASGLADANLRLQLVTERMLPIVPGMISLPFGGLYDPSTIPKDIASLESYYHSLGFFDVQITPTKLFNEDKSRLVIRYDIEEGMRYRVSRIKYKGNRVYTKSELTANRSLDPKDFYNERALKEDVTFMKDLYGDLGRLFSTVEPVIQYSEKPGTVSLVYKIDEDRPIYVRNITTDIRGDYPHSRETLLLSLAQIHPGDLADPDLIQRSKSRIAGSGLFKRGMTDGVKIEIERVSFEELAMPDLPDLDSPRIRGQSPANPAAPPPFPRTDTEQAATAGSGAGTSGPTGSTRRVRSQRPTYLPPRRGQPASSARTTPRVRPAGATTPPPAGAAPVSGTSPFAAPSAPASGPPPVVYAQGTVNPYAQQPVIEPLAGEVGDYTPPFYPSSPQGNPLQGVRPGYVDINISAAEARTGRLMIGASVNSNSGLMGNIVFSENNFDITRFPRSFSDLWNGTAFRGDGQKFRVEAVPGTVVSRYLVSWTDPDIFETRYSLGTSGFYFQRFYPDWDTQRAGGRVTVGRQLTRLFSIRGIFRGETVEISNPSFPTPDLLQKALGDNTLLTLGAGFTFDNRDSAMLPSEGQIVEFTYTQGVTDFQYPRFDVEGTQYYTVFSRPDGTGKHILSLGGQFGWTGEGTPIFERYFAGGFQSLRGFQYRGVGPRVFGVNIGGQFLLAGSVQYMFPLLANDALRGVVFTDFGTVNKEISLDNFRASVGTGLRITIPAFGPAPLAFDFAFPVARAPGDEEQIFSFYIGVQR